MTMIPGCQETWGRIVMGIRGNNREFIANFEQAGIGEYFVVAVN
jgi:hypothetical protein